MKILVTGGAGFIASNVVDTYIEAGHDVAIIDNLSTGKKQNLNPKARFYEIDLRNAKEVESVFENERPEIVNHHAAQIDVRKSVADPVYDAEVNIIGFLNVAQNCLKYKVKKVIFASTGGAIYGEVKKGGATEKTVPEPISPYAICKRTIEMHLHAYAVNFGLRWTVLRYGNVFGPRQDPLGEAGVIAIFIGKLMKGETPLIFGTGKQLRDYVYVKDVARANLMALKKGEGEIINIGTAVGSSVVDLFKHLKAIMKFPGEAKSEPPRTGELFRSVLAINKAKLVLGWTPKMTLRKGLEETVDWQTRLSK
jgi:UDP-glucose 4-epimerase